MYTVEQSVRLVQQWCPAAKRMTRLKIRGSMFGELIRGRVVGCARRRCPHRNSSKCLIEHVIQTKAE